MHPRVPASKSEVDAAAECDGIIGDDDLLMVDRAGRVCAVDRKVHAGWGDHIEQADRCNTEPESVEGGQQPQIRLEQIDPQVRPPPYQPVQEGPEVIGAGQRFLVGLEGGPVIEIPADQHDAAPGAQHRRLHIGEVIGTVDDAAEAIRAGGAPAGFAGPQNAIGWFRPSVAHGTSSRCRSSRTVRIVARHVAPRRRPRHYR